MRFIGPHEHWLQILNGYSKMMKKSGKKMDGTNMKKEKEEKKG